MRISGVARLLGLFAILLASRASATFVSGSTGTDGAFAPVANTVVDLSLAGTGPGTGTYDAARWAVVFNYTSVNIPAGVTVTFKNHPSGAPVVWLVGTFARVAGAVNLSGANGAGSPAVATYAEPGPGGFAGGRRGIELGVSPGTSGLGPGGGQFSVTNNPSTLGSGGGYGTVGSGDSFGAIGGVVYGNEAVLPLIGGSGGSAGDQGGTFGGGGAGGGALLIAATDSVVVALGGSILANGGNRSTNSRGGGGSGGAIRLISNAVGGDGVLRASGGNAISGLGGSGRIRVEAPVAYLTDPGAPAYSVTSIPGPIFPPPGSPSLAVTSVQSTQGSVPVSPDPLAGILTIDAIVADSLVTPVTLHIAAAAVPVGTSVEVRVIRDAGPFETFTSTPLAGTLVSSTATCVISLARGRKTEVLLKANFTPAGVALSPPTTIRP